MRFRVLVFDFDGTLVDSNSLKRQAFDHIFADRPECIRALPSTMEQLKNGSRHEIIQAVVERIRGLSRAQRVAETTRRTEAYSAWVNERILERAQQSPAGVLLPRWQCHAALYLCSLTPTEPLKHVLRNLGWLSYFEGVEGYPVNKTDMLRRTLSRHDLRSDEALMVGDGDGDELAAEEAGTAFFRMRKIQDLTRLDEYLFT